MAVVQGVKERVHLPIYDSLTVKPTDQLSDSIDSNTIKFFVDVQGKTKLETNLQAAGLLPHYNTFEARAMRVVISDLPPEFPDEPSVPTDPPVEVTDESGTPLQIWTDTTNKKLVVDEVGSAAHGTATTTPLTAVVEFALNDLIDQLRAARQDSEGNVDIATDDDSVTLTVDPATLKDTTNNISYTEDDVKKAVANADGKITFYDTELEDLLDSEKDISAEERPLDEQIEGNGGSATLLSKLIYNTVTSLFVGEKAMIEMPTWFFPAGAGIYSENGSFTTHGEPNPTATFRFAEPIYIDKQQNFRVEIVIPDSDTLKELQRIYGPLFIWVVLDGYMTRDVQ